MGHAPGNNPSHLPLPLLRLHLRLRANIRTCYPSFTARRLHTRPLALLSILFVLSIVAVGTYLVLPLTLLPALHEPTTRPAAAFWTLVFSWTIACTLLSYFLTALAHPGKVPETWRAESFQREHPNKPAIPIHLPPGDPAALTTKLYPIPPPVISASGTAMLRADGRYRFCIICNHFKPDRTHHCSSCQECVLLMDHHCPFTGNGCIGHQNRKFFLLFLYYATLSCAQVALLTPRTLYNRLAALDENATSEHLAAVIAMLFGYMLCAMHALALAAFASFHTYLVLNNRTTIENQEARPLLHADVLRRSDKGALANWRAVFGPRIWLWFVPVALGREGDACHWGNRIDDIV